MSFIYIASPYSHQDAEVRQQRFEAVAAVTAEAIINGIAAYSPIVHNHQLSLDYGIAGDFEFWQRHNYATLCKASRLHVLCLDGWEESVGVAAEIAFAEQCGIPVVYISP